MRIIQKLEKAYRSLVELVEIEGVYYVLKTSSREVIVNEREFLSVMAAHTLPTLRMYDNPQLEKNQLLLEYIQTVPVTVTETEENMEKWGNAVKNMHAITFDSCFKITEQGVKQTMDWNDFLRSMLFYGLQRQHDRHTSLSDSFLKKISTYVESRLPVPPVPHSLLSCDLHSENVLYKNGEAIIYDKESEVFAGDYRYDLAAICSQYRHRPELLSAFLRGYSEDVMQTAPEIMNLYIVLHALSRHPNPFLPHLTTILEEIVTEKNPLDNI